MKLVEEDKFQFAETDIILRLQKCNNTPIIIYMRTAKIGTKIETIGPFFTKTIYKPKADD